MVKIVNTQDLVSLVQKDIESLSVQKEGDLYIALPGGRSAASLIEAMLNLPSQVVQRIRLFLVDERLEGEKNIDTLLEAGLQNLLDNGTTILLPSLQETLPIQPFDRVYLGIGEDGHFASLFPGSWPEFDYTMIKEIANSPKPPKRRVTLTYHGFLHTCKDAEIFLLFLGEGKRDALFRLLGGNEDMHTLPSSFFVEEHFNATIITDLQE